MDLLFVLVALRCETHVYINVTLPIDVTNYFRYQSTVVGCSSISSEKCSTWCGIK